MIRPWLDGNNNQFQVRKLAHIARLKARIGWQNLRTEEFTDEGPFCVTGTDFKNGMVNWDTSYHVSPERYEIDVNIQLQEDDLLITKDGTIGKVAVVRDMPSKATLNSGVFLLRSQGEGVNTAFMKWIVQSKVFDDFVTYNSTGSTINHLYQNVFEQFRFPYPDADTQKAIADFLDRETARIDQLIEKKQELQSILKIKTQAMLERYFTFGLVTERSRKATGLSWLPTIPASWEITAIKRIVKVKDGTHETPGYVEADEKAFPLITSKDFVDQSIDFSGAKYISAQDHELIYRRSNTQQGDVLMSMIGGNIGKSILVTDDREFSIKNVALFKTTGNHRLARQVLLFLRSPLFTEQLRLLGRGGAQDFIGLGDIRNLMFPVIPSEELDKLVSEASEKSDELKEIHDRIELSVIRLREFRSAIITAAVTGQIDIRTWGRNKQTDRHLDQIEEDTTPRRARA